jgi:hypothetical protein
MEPVLNEQSRRRWAATEAKALGRGGVSCVVRVTGLARRTVYRGLMIFAAATKRIWGASASVAEAAGQRSLTTPRF